MVYVRRGGLDVSPPPWKCDDIHATVFYIQADAGSLQLLCDRTLNQPSGPDPSNPGKTRLQYKPFVDWVALTFQTFRGIQSQAPPDPGSLVRERHTYSEAAFWVMVDRGAGLEVLIPYMFITDPICMVAGRESYGFPKEFAEIDMPSPGGALHNGFAIKAPAVVPGGQDQKMLPILRCVPANGTKAVQFPGLEDAEALLDASEVLRKMKAIFDVFVEERLNFVFLRQFRALRGGPGAELQAVVAAQARPFRIDLPSLRILTDYQLSLGPLLSHPIAKDLGLAGNPVSVPFGFECDLAFTLQAGMPV